MRLQEEGTFKEEASKHQFMRIGTGARFSKRKKRSEQKPLTLTRKKPVRKLIKKGAAKYEA